MHNCRQQIEVCDTQIRGIQDLKCDIRCLEENLTTKASKDDFDAWVLAMPSYAKVMALRETREEIQGQLIHISDRFA